MLVADVGDEMCWWQLWDVGGGFGHYGDKHPLSLHLSVKHQPSKDVTNIEIQLPTLCHQHHDFTNITVTKINLSPNWILNMELYLNLEIFTFFGTFRNKRTHSTTLWFISNNMKGRLTKRIIKVRQGSFLQKWPRFFRIENIKISWKFWVKNMGSWFYTKLFVYVD